MVSPGLLQPWSLTDSAGSAKAFWPLYVRNSRLGGINSSLCLSYEIAMPLYATENWKITMYFCYHSPPHFDVLTKDRREAQVRIADRTVVAGSVPAQSRACMAAGHRALLNATWLELHPQ